MPRKYEEHQATYKFGKLTGHSEATENPREAGDRAREFTEYAEGNGPGVIEIQARTVTVGDWETVEKREYKGDDPNATKTT